jgi:hypothetical protein
VRLAAALMVVGAIVEFKPFDDTIAMDVEVVT